jgi:hypothetical protein
MDDHPAEKCFDSIRNKTPAHFDHKKMSGSDYPRGGGTGFNLHEGIASESVDSPADPSMPITQPMMPKGPPPSGVPSEIEHTKAGIDFQVPPIHRY